MNDDARTHPRWALLGVAAAVVLLLDQLSKNWAVDELSRRSIDLVWTLRLQLTFNKGVAFSLGGDKGQVFAIIALCVIAFVLYTERTDTTKLGAFARGLIVGGALGNLSDRLLRDHQLGNGFLTGRVVDFVDLQWWPVFNIADAAVVVGSILLVVSLLFQGDDRVAETDGADADRRADLSG